MLETIARLGLVATKSRPQAADAPAFNIARKEDMMATSPADAVSLTVANNVATILFNRCDRRNALTLDMWRTLPALVARAEADSGARVIVLRGVAGHFGSGNDIREFATTCADAPSAARFGQAMADATGALERTAKPSIAAIEGCCYGASLALALSCDLRIASDDATFAITPAKLGALYLRSDLRRLERAIGRSRALDLIFTARRVAAAEALRLGLVNRLAAQTSFGTLVAESCECIAAGSPFTLRATKAMFRETDEADPTLDPDGIGWFVRATQGEDFREGVDAFLAKREPRFLSTS